ncbi:hypothetical protein L249_6086 [Ophiocordyceps polyrhachis-furcata BCC 54312]|uniref:Nuclear envelope protein n=1 Tax=Ophiocordyceps polyrhachis-furcata BCC 54312 TaxID=1330021 RepID=A0A367LIQ7_9HYPO|nr:hypothetical protein L249_6086 [Ophiocordyceps polyrhachis-furcata BCC 54312]
MAGTPSRRAPYKDTLQPALHRRFSSTATLLLAASYLEALLLTPWTSFLWSWFPFGPCGIRTGVIFTCGLAILILRIANYHVGFRTTASGIHSLGFILTSPRTYETGFWYGLSAWVFCPVFLASMPSSSNLRWITYWSGDRARLNERPLMLACYSIMCALWQTIRHYRLDLDRVEFGLPRAKAEGRDVDQASSSMPLQAFLSQVPRVLSECALQASLTLLLTIVFYFACVRSFAWSWTMTFLRPFYNLPQSRIPPPTWPVDLFLMARCIYAGTLLFAVWSTGNTAFSLFMVKEPLKNGKPLTSESKDPNGSLLNGLKSKKPSIQSFAMWELALISKDFDARRQAIFRDIDRKDGPMWTQICAVCMELLLSIEQRVDQFERPETTAVTPPAEVPVRQRVSAPLRDEPIMNQTNRSYGLIGGVEKVWDQMGRAPGSTPASELSPLAKKTWKDAKDRILSKEQQEALRPEHIRSGLSHWAAGFVDVPGLGCLLRQDAGTQLAAVVLGTPYAEPTVYINAVEALCQLAVHSLAEDEFGVVQRDVASVVRIMTAVTGKVEGLKRRFPNHWTFAGRTPESPAVDAITEALRTGLDRLVTTFEPYSSDLGLSRGDVRLAKEAATAPRREAKDTVKGTEKRKSMMMMATATTATASKPRRVPERERERERNRERERELRGERGVVALVWRGRMALADAVVVATRP